MGCFVAYKDVFLPFGLIYDGTHFVIAQDVETPLKGFILIGSKRNFQSISDMTKEEYSEYNSLVLQTRKIFKKILGDIQYTMIQEEDSSHFHLWFFPWYNWVKTNPKDSKDPKLGRL